MQNFTLILNMLKKLHKNAPEKSFFFHLTKYFIEKETNAAVLIT